MTPHELIKHRLGQYECRVCMQTWSGKPVSNCPGLKLYPKNDHVPLMTKEQLGYSGYQTTPKSLPAPVGCFYSHGAGGRSSYISLYDPTQAIKKKTSRARRVTMLLTEVCWPWQAVPLIEELSQFLQDRSLYKDRTYEVFMNEIANMAAHFAAFTPHEIEQLAGASVQLMITPSLARRSYPSFEINTKEQVALASRIAAAYERYKATL